MPKDLKNTAASDFFKSMGAGTSSDSVAIASSNIGRNDKDEATVSISLPKKSREKKLISLRVNVTEYEEFSSIVEGLGYKNSEVLNHFIRDFIKANRNKNREGL